MLQYRARITYNENALMRLCKAQHTVFNRIRILVLYSICILVLAAAITTEMGQIKRILLIAAAGITISFSNYVPVYKAKTMIAAYKGIFPTVTYNFYVDDFELENENGSKKMKYNSITGLVEDQEYIYLFVSKTQAYAVDRQRIRPREPDELVAFLSEKTGNKVRKIGKKKKMRLSSFFPTKK